METRNRITEELINHPDTTATDLAKQLGLSKRTVFKQLALLTAEGAVEKVGTPPKVFYKVTEKSTSKEIEDIEQFQLNRKELAIIEDNYIYITPLGEYLKGINGFTFWCKERNLDPEKQIKQYLKLHYSLQDKRQNGLINATKKIDSSFDVQALNQLFYIDFYSIPQFGKTKLGQLLLYAKQSQDIKRISIISNIVKEPILKLIKSKKIDAVGFIPPTIKREVQFMKELERNLHIELPIIDLIKAKTDVIVPQKTLSKLEDRVTNARNTIMVSDRRVFKNVLLIDDAVGSGATLNETATKLKKYKYAKNVYGIAIAGSYKGFEVISEV